MHFETKVATASFSALDKGASHHQAFASCGVALSRYGTIIGQTKCNVEKQERFEKKRGPAEPHSNRVRRINLL